jgi:hypothetical protein
MKDNKKRTTYEESFLDFVDYYAMNGWQKLAFFAILAFLAVQIIKAIEGVAARIYYLFSPAFGGDGGGERTAVRSTRYASVRLSDDLSLDAAFHSGDGSVEPPNAVGISLDGKRVIGSGYINDFLGTLYVYLRGDIKSDREYRIGETLTAKICRRVNDDGYDLCLCANEKEYLFDSYNVSLIYTALKENLSKCGVTGAVSSEIYNAYAPKKTDKDRN